MKMMGKKIREKFRDARFSRKIYLAFLLLAVVSVLPLGFFSWYQVRINLLDQGKRNVKEQFLMADAMLNGRILQCQSVITSLLYNVQLNQCLNTEDISYYEQYLMFSNTMEPIIGNILSTDSNVLEMKIYTDNPTLKDHSRYLYSLEKFQNYGGDGGEKLCYRIEDQKMAVSCPYPKNEKKLTHILYLEFRMEDVLSMVENNHFKMILTDAEGNLVYESEGVSFTDVDLQAEDFALTESGGRKFYYLTEEIRETGWTSICLIPAEILVIDNTGILQLTGVLFLCTVLIALLFSSKLSRWLVAPMEKLHENIRQIEEGDFSMAISSEAGDEIGQLTNAFGDMTRKLNTLVNEVYKSKIIQREAEFKMLQAQLNPHFLYNTLSFINWSALRAGEKEIAKISRDISTFYRTALNSGGTLTTVEEELKNAKSYVDIQMALHHGSFKAEYEINPGCLEQSVICNVLQPLIENALEHGIDKRRDKNGRLQILADLQDGQLLLAVADNGPGFTREAQERALREDSASYGLKNVNERIRIYYGEEYGIRISSGKDEDTRIEIRVPI